MGILNISFFNITGSGLHFLSSTNKNNGPPDLLFITASALRTLDAVNKNKKNKYKNFNVILNIKKNYYYLEYILDI